MDLLLFLPGAAILGLTAVDIWWTTLWVDGGVGPLTRGLMRLLRAGTDRLGAPAGVVSRSLTGPLGLAGTVSWWLLLSWAGWSLVFLSEPDALARVQPGREMDAMQVVYFAGNTFFTLGPGEILPRGAFWQVATALAAGSGMLFITLSTTYLLRFLGAVVDERGLANQVLDVAEDPVGLVLATWDGEGFDHLDALLESVSPAMARVSQQYHVFPLLHHYHSTDPRSASGRAVVVLDEALTLVSLGVAPHARPRRLSIRTLRSAVSRYLGTLPGAHIRPAPEAPPAPSLRRLREAGVPTVDDAVFHEALRDLDGRRRWLRALVARDGWEWPQE